MTVPADSLTLILLGVIAVAILALAVGAIMRRAVAVREQKQIQAVRTAILDYFTRNGVGVAAACFRMAGDKRFTAVVESEPMKRFRLSHIIEATLREHVRKGCGLELDKVYWRFPINTAVQAQAGSPDAKPEQEADNYINEGLDHYRHIPKPEVEELSWEQFEKATTTVGRPTDAT